MFAFILFVGGFLITKKYLVKPQVYHLFSAAALCPALSLSLLSFLRIVILVLSPSFETTP